MENIYFGSFRSESVRKIMVEALGGAAATLEYARPREVNGATRGLNDFAGEKKWVAWRVENRNGKPTKMPKNPATGRNAQVPTNPATYGTRAAAERCWQKIKKEDENGGIGIVLGDDLVGCDLDSCRDPKSGEIADWAKEVIERFDTYAEVSPSGTGVKLFFTMSAEDKTKLQALLGLDAEGDPLTRKTFAAGKHREVAIDTARFYAVTGQRLEDSPEDLRQEVFRDVEWFIKEAGPRYLKTQKRGNGGEPFVQHGESYAKQHDESGSGHGFRFMRQCHADGMSFEEACEAILGDEGDAGEWANRVDERQLKRAWENSKPKVEEAAENPLEIVAKAHTFPSEASLEQYDWLYARHLLRGEVAGTAATGGTGKSSMSIVEALAMASGKPLLHDDSSQSGPRSADQFRRQAQHHGEAHRGRDEAHKLKPEDIGDRLIVLAKGEIKIKVAKQVRTGAAERNVKIVEALTNLVKEKHIDVVSIDSFIRTHSVNENDNSAIEGVVECFEDIALLGNCALHLWHHTRKGNGMEATAESARGAKAFVDACRSTRILETMSEKQGEQMGVDNYKLHFRSFSGKLNFAPPIDDSDWFRIAGVTLMNGPHGSAGDNIGAVEAWQAPEEAEMTPDKVVGIQNAVANGNWRDNVRAEMWAGKVIGPIVGLDPDDDNEKRRLNRLIGKLIKDGYLRREPGKTPGRKDTIFLVPGDIEPVPTDPDAEPDVFHPVQPRGKEKIADKPDERGTKPGDPMCEVCGETLKSQRKDARFCSTKCRMKAHRGDEA